MQLTGGARPAGAPTTVPEAYDSYLKSRIARQELNPNSPTLMPDIERISTLLEDAVRRDPKFGLARLELANHLVQLFTDRRQIPRDCVKPGCNWMPPSGSSRVIQS